MTALAIAEAMRRVSSGDQSPPRPWAYLSGLGITSVGDVSSLLIDGYVNAAGFEMIVDGKLYMVRVEEAVT